MQKSDNQVAVKIHRKPKPSTTLNRKYARPVDGMTKKTTHIKVSSVGTPQPTKKSSKTTTTPHNPSPKELKDRAIEKALKNASHTTPEPTPHKLHFGLGRVLIAIACTAVIVCGIVYLASINMPDFSLKVASLQTGIEASYPSYIPRDFTLSDITSEEGKVTMNFQNSTTGDAFSLIEEASSWDSNALLANFVKDNYRKDYSTIREQGLTIYIDGSNACWVNGGVVYKITTTSGSLTKKQIKSIATSL